MTAPNFDGPPHEGGCAPYTWEELAEAERQIGSTLHKLREAVKTLEGKSEPARYKSQITLAKRRIRAFTIARELIGRELDRRSPSCNTGKETSR